MNVKRKLVSNLTSLFSRIATVMISGLPRNKVLFKPVNKSFLQYRKENVKINSEKYYHKPIAKPVVEKQTLLKEKKKIRTTH